MRLLISAALVIALALVAYWLLSWVFSAALFALLVGNHRLLSVLQEQRLRPRSRPARAMRWTNFIKVLGLAGALWAADGQAAANR